MIAFFKNITLEIINKRPFIQSKVGVVNMQSRIRQIISGT